MKKILKSHAFLMISMSYLSIHKLMGAGGIAYHSRFSQESRTMMSSRKTQICHRDETLSNNESWSITRLVEVNPEVTVGCSPSSLGGELGVKWGRQEQG